MSNPGETPRMAPGSDRFKFSNTCNLLSRYIKEKGGLGDLAIDLMALRPSHHSTKGKSVDLPPPAEEPSRKGVVLPDLNAVTASSQMTIFYGGKVIVFEDFPEEKAREIIAMAGEGIARVPPTTQSCPPPLPSTSGAAEKPKELAPEHVPVSSADLPIARRISLNRFLEKRKDRISSKAPYQVQDSPHAASSSSSPPPHEKPQASNQEDPKSWLGLAPSAPSSSSEPRKQ